MLQQNRVNVTQFGVSQNGANVTAHIFSKKINCLWKRSMDIA